MKQLLGFFYASSQKLFTITGIVESTKPTRIYLFAYVFGAQTNPSVKLEAQNCVSVMASIVSSNLLLHSNFGMPDTKSSFFTFVAVEISTHTWDHCSVKI